MKKAICLMSIITLIFLSSACTGVSQNSEYRIMRFEQSYSDSLLESDIEFTFGKKEGYFVREDAAQTLSQSINGNTVEGVYKESKYGYGNYFVTDRYKAENSDDSTWFEVDSEGMLAGYTHKRSKVKPGKECSEDECIEIARAFMKNIIDVSDYKMESKYDEAYDSYKIMFTKYVNDFKTMDRAYVSVDKSGDVYLYTSNMLGKVPADVSTNFDLKAVKSTIEAKLDVLYENTKKTHDKTEYIDSEEILSVLEDGTPVLLVWYEIEYSKFEGEYEICSSDKIGFVVEKQ